MGTMVTDLAAGRALLETHISWVVLDEHDVYKLKKPVNFGFLDFTTLERRHAACVTEVELNSRLTHGVYLGVKPVTRDEAGRHSIGGQGEIVDYCVHMRRLGDGHRLDHLLRQNLVTPELMSRLAVHLAAFHARSSTNAEVEQFGEVAVIRRNVDENFTQTRTHIAEFMTADEARELERSQLSFLDNQRARFEERIRAGRIRDGHGDLRLEHVYCSGEGFDVLDCIEFNDRFRYADVACDLAFLTMELRQAGRPDLAEALLAAYATETTDFQLYTLIDFYESYRAVVRAKVNSFVAVDAKADAETREAARRRASGLFRQARLGLGARPTGPMIAVGGLIAAGKSHVSARLSNLLACPIVATDRVRKHLLGVDRYTNVAVGKFEGAYSEATTQRTYEAVRTFARAVVESGRPVIVDASFRSRHERTALRQWCEDVGCRLLFVECVAPHEVLRGRLRERASGPSVSDGREELLDAFLAKYEPPSELPASARCELDTTQSDAEQRRALEAFISQQGLSVRHVN